MISKLQPLTKEKAQRIKYKTSELERRYYKLLKIQANNLGFIPLRKLPKIHLKNYCILTGEARSVYSKSFKISRHQIKTYFTFLTGLKNSSW